MAEACAPATRELRTIFPGSWIDANFYIWIGHPDDQRAWTQLADARARLEATAPPPGPPSVPGDGVARDGVAPDGVALDGNPIAGLSPRAAALEEILIAEGSDWCWWYGVDHSSAHDAEFDDLFRRHLRNAYRLMDQPTPDELYVSNISSAPSEAQSEPTGFVVPTLDGEETSYFEWLGAGTFEVHDAAGAMHQIDRPRSSLTHVRFGFSHERLFLRVDARKPMADLLAEGLEVSFKFLRPAGIRYSVVQRGGRAEGSFWRRHQEPPFWRLQGPGTALVAAGRILEVAIPFSDLGAGPDGVVSFFVAVYDANNAERERHPVQRPLDVQLPDALFEARHWRA
jgi:hypothetical protein